VITLSYGVAGLAVLHVFRHEVMQLRASSALYLFGVVAAAAMLVTDAYGHSLFRLAEFPAQIGAVGLLFLAHWQRFSEVEVLRRSALGAKRIGMAAGDPRSTIDAEAAVAPVRADTRVDG
jgi:hypothetical protein